MTSMAMLKLQPLIHSFFASATDSYTTTLEYFERHPLLPEIEAEDDGSMSWEDASEGPPSVDNPPPEIQHRLSEGDGSQPMPVQAPSPDRQPESDDLLTDLRLQLSREMVAAEYDLRLARFWTADQLNSALQLVAFNRHELEELRPEDPALWRCTHEKAGQASAELESPLETALAILILDEGRRTRQKDVAAMEDEFHRKTGQHQERQGRYDAAMGLVFREVAQVV
ncbi:hypothetical protein GE09DRAFT_35580 [Coniochaeta sp. 2T2.1]|nr:hypothetical protein GE09DRAFT_35580 [Coniochaeta sp. 2T2.1]